MAANRKLLAGAVIGVVVLVGVGVAAYFLLFRDDAPPPPSITEAAESAEESAGTNPTDTSDQADARVDGGWSIVPGPQATVDEGTYVGYRVQEELAQIGTQDAVGRTRAVTGTIEIDGTTVTSVEIEADVTQLTSDEANRDGQMRQQALETNAFPNAAFSLTEPIELDAIPAEGETIQVVAMGDLTLHGVTRPVELTLEAQLVADQIVVVGGLPIAFADYDIDKPQSFRVLSVNEDGTLELQLFFERG